MSLLILIWFVLWPILCLLLIIVTTHANTKNNRERVGWAETPKHPSFGLVIKKGQPFVTLQLAEKQFLFEYPDELEKLLEDGEKQHQRARTMAAVLDDSLMKSEMERELDSL